MYYKYDLIKELVYINLNRCKIVQILLRIRLKPVYSYFEINPNLDKPNKKLQKKQNKYQSNYLNG